MHKKELTRDEVQELLAAAAAWRAERHQRSAQALASLVDRLVGSSDDEPEGLRTWLALPAEAKDAVCTWLRWCPKDPPEREHRHAAASALRALPSLIAELQRLRYEQADILDALSGGALDEEGDETLTDLAWQVSAAARSGGYLVERWRQAVLPGALADILSRLRTGGSGSLAQQTANFLEALAEPPK